MGKGIGTGIGIGTGGRINQCDVMHTMLCGLRNSAYVLKQVVSVVDIGLDRWRKSERAGSLRRQIDIGRPRSDCIFGIGGLKMHQSN